MIVRTRASRPILSPTSPAWTASSAQSCRPTKFTPAPSPTSTDTLEAYRTDPVCRSTIVAWAWAPTEKMTLAVDLLIDTVAVQLHNHRVAELSARRHLEQGGATAERHGER